MNSIEMTNPNPTKPDGQNPIAEEFSFTSSSKMKLTNHLNRFKWFGVFTIALVMIVTFSAVAHTSKLRNKTALVSEMNFNQIQGQDSNLVLNAKDDELNALWSREDSESSDSDDEEVDAAQLKDNNGTTSLKKAGKRILEINGSIYKDAWRALRSKVSRFAVLRQNVWNPRLVDAKLGEWSSTFTEFKAEFPVAETAIGFIYLGNTGQERFYQVVYIPQSVDVEPATVVAKYGLASDPNLLAKVTGLPVANTIVVRSFRELNALNIMKNAKAGAVVSLWSAEVADELLSSTAVLAADGSNYYSAWSSLKSKFSRYVVFTKNPSNPSRIDAKLGSWSSGINDFKNQFPSNDVAVGFIILNNELIEVVYVPPSKLVKPSKVLADFNLPANPYNLKSNGLDVPSTIVVKNTRDITTSNLASNSYRGVISLWDDEEIYEVIQSTQVLAADGGNYAAIWNSFKAKTNRFVVFKKNAQNPKQIDARVGLWRALVSDFQAEFPVNEEAVGFMLLGSDANPQLYEVVYVPPNKNINAAQVVASFGLPSNPALLRSGLQVADTIVVRNYKDINTGNIVMNSKKAGIISAWDELTSMWWVTSTGTANDGSNYADVWNTMKGKTKRFVIFRQNAQNPRLIDAEFGDWNATSADFAAAFQVNKPQVGYAYLGTKKHEKLYEVVYVPRGLKTNPATVLVNFGLPPNPSKLAQFDIEVPSTFVTTDKKQIDTGNIIMKATPAGIISLWDESISDVLESTQVLAADGGNYAAVWNSIKSETNRFVVFRKNAKNPKQVDARVGLWRSLVSDFQAEFPVNEEAVGFIVLGSGNNQQLYEVVYIPPNKNINAAQVLASFGLPADPKLLRSGLQVADTIVVKNYKDIATTNIVLNSKKAGIISLWDEDVSEVLESTQVLAADGGNYATLWNEMKAKTKRFVVFRKNPQNPKQIEAKVGIWNTLVSDFQAQFLADQEGVGFMLLGSDANPQLYEVIYIPPNKNINAAQVVASFGLPSDPNLLKSNGLPVANTVVLKSYSDINTINMVMKSKQGGIISLWDEEAEVAELLKSTQVLAFDGANYAQIWNAIKTKSARFVVFKKNAANPKQIDARVGVWNTLVSDFQAEFPANQEAVGFIVLGSGNYEQLYEVVYVPSSRNIAPAQVVASFNLPSDPKLLKSGLQVADTVVINNYKDITSNNIMINSRKAGIIGLWDEDVSEVLESTQVLAADGSNYAAVWNNMKAKTNRFVVFRKNAKNPKQLDARIGAWNTLMSDFQAEFPVGEEAVGFIILGGGNYEQLYEVVYVPSTKKLTPAQVLASFGLPSDPKLLKSGLQVADTIVVTNYKDIATTNIVLNSKKAGIISAWWNDKEEEDDVSTAASESEIEDELQSLWWSSSESDNDGSTYSDVWNTLKGKTKRFVVFRQNAQNPKLVDVEFGAWNTTSADFAAAFQVNKPQVGYAYLGTKYHERLYEVVYAPTSLKIKPATILNDLGLPLNPNKLADFGLEVPSIYVANNKKLIDTGNIILKANSNSTEIIS